MNNPETMIDQLKQLNMFDRVKDMPGASPMYFKFKTEGAEEQSKMAFQRYFNPALAKDSDYFASVDRVMKCVEKHAGEELSE